MSMLVDLGPGVSPILRPTWMESFAQCAVSPAVLGGVSLHALARFKAWRFERISLTASAPIKFWISIALKRGGATSGGALPPRGRVHFGDPRRAIGYLPRSILGGDMRCWFPITAWRRPTSFHLPWKTWRRRFAGWFSGRRSWTLDLSRLVLAGESAGGNLTAALTLALVSRRSEPFVSGLAELRVLPKAVVVGCGFLEVSSAHRQVQHSAFVRARIANIVASYVGGVSLDRPPSETFLTC